MLILDLLRIAFQHECHRCIGVAGVIGIECRHSTLFLVQCCALDGSVYQVGCLFSVETFAQICGVTGEINFAGDILQTVQCCIGKIQIGDVVVVAIQLFKSVILRKIKHMQLVVCTRQILQIGIMGHIQYCQAVFITIQLFKSMQRSQIQCCQCIVCSIQFSQCREIRNTGQISDLFFTYIEFISQQLFNRNEISFGNAEDFSQCSTEVCVREIYLIEQNIRIVCDHDGQLFTICHIIDVFYGSTSSESQYAILEFSVFHGHIIGINLIVRQVNFDLVGNQ